MKTDRATRKITLTNRNAEVMDRIAMMQAAAQPTRFQWIMAFLLVVIFLLLPLLIIAI